MRAIGRITETGSVVGVDQLTDADLANPCEVVDDRDQPCPAEAAWLVQALALLPGLDDTPAKLMCSHHKDNVARHFTYCLGHSIAYRLVVVAL